MSDFSAENAQDYLGFLRALENDLLACADSAHRMVQHAPPDHKNIMETTAQFMTHFAYTVVHTEIILTELCYCQPPISTAQH